MQCEVCGAVALVHLTEIKDGTKSDRYLCEACAAKVYGLPVGKPSISELMRKFVEKHRGEAKGGMADEKAGE